MVTLILYLGFPSFEKSNGRSCDRIVNPLIPGGTQKGHTYLKPESYRFVLVCVTFLLPPGIKGLIAAGKYLALYINKPGIDKQTTSSNTLAGNC